ncbi:histidine phosphatase family protein [Streptomyces sp. x-80]|uniref:histidine phosphatase family protein n=1 Tax=Streptomyces sp. x-80 TaxID=2789282 RepID=UPI0039815B1A
MRHGAYEGHRPGHHAPYEAVLTLEGRDQVHRSLPLPEGITVLVTSPIPRARQTATLISHLTGLPIVATTGFLAEWRAPSIVLGRTADTYPPAYRAWRIRRLVNPTLRCEDGESLTDLHTRARHCATFLHHTAQCHGPLLAISHTPASASSLAFQEGPAPSSLRREAPGSSPSFVRSHSGGHPTQQQQPDCGTDRMHRAVRGLSDIASAQGSLLPTNAERNREDLKHPQSASPVDQCHGAQCHRREGWPHCPIRQSGH